MDEFNILQEEAVSKPSMGEMIERLRLKTKLITYQEKFPDELKVYDFKMSNLENYSIEELETFLQEVQLAVRMRNSGNMIKNFYFGGIDFIEKASTKLGADLTGLHNILLQQKEVHKILDELSLLYEDQMLMPPHLRLAYTTLQVVLTVYQIKKTENIINKELEKKVPEEVLEEYKDL